MMALSGYVYKCSAGETFDSVAMALYGDEKYAAELLNANPALCETMIFSGGEVLEMPVVETAVDTQNSQQIGPAPWKE